MRVWRRQQHLVTPVTADVLCPDGQVVLAALLAVAVARPRYVLMPVDELERMPPHVRVARQAVYAADPQQPDASDR